MELKKIDDGRAFDFGKTAALYAAYRDIYPAAVYDRLKSLGVAADNTAWLDLGTGTGVLPKNLYNPKASITGADISPEQIAWAKKEAVKNGWDIDYIVAPAEATGLADNSLDTITAAQCFWYFDREKMRSEIRRMLKPGGRFIKVYLGFLPDDEISKVSVELVERFNPQWTPGASGADDMFDDLFPGRQTERFEADLPFTRESWHGRMCACRGTFASMDEASLAAWQDAHEAFLSTCPPQFTVRHDVVVTWFDL